MRKRSCVICGWQKPSAFKDVNFSLATASWGVIVCKQKGKAANSLPVYLFVRAFGDSLWRWYIFMPVSGYILSQNSPIFQRSLDQQSFIDFFESIWVCKTFQMSEGEYPSVCAFTLCLWCWRAWHFYSRNKQCNVNPGCSFTQRTLGTCPYHFSFLFFL